MSCARVATTTLKTTALTLGFRHTNVHRNVSSTSSGFVARVASSRSDSIGRWRRRRRDDAYHRRARARASSSSSAARESFRVSNVERRTVTCDVTGCVCMGKQCCIFDKVSAEFYLLYNVRFKCGDGDDADARARCGINSMGWWVWVTRRDSHPFRLRRRRLRL